MVDPAERFIAAATAPLAGNAELHIAARNELVESIGSAEDGARDPLDQATERLENADRSSTGKWYKIGLYLILGVLSVAAIASAVRSLIDFRLGSHLMLGIGYGRIDEAHFLASLSSHLKPQERMILLGDMTKSRRSDRIKGLWDSEPENPAYFADYVSAYSSDHGVLPRDLLSTADKLDPGNAWFVALAASERSQFSMDPNARPTLTPGGAKLRAVKDQAKLDEAIELFHQAAQLEQFDGYQEALLKRRIPLLPPRTDAASQFAPLTYLAGLPSPILRFRHLVDAIQIKANQLAKSGDKEGFRRLLADWDKFTATYASAFTGNLVDGLVRQVVIRVPLKALSEAAVDLGMPEDAKRLKDLDDRFQARKTAMGSRVDPNSEIGLHSSLLAGLSLPAVSEQTLKALPIPPEDLTPGRMADHAIAGRIMSLVAWLILGLLLLATGFYRFRSSLLIRRLSARMMLLLRPVDWAWIIGFGILLPLTYYQIILRLTPLGAREWSLKASNFIVPAGQFSAMLWTMVLLPILIARRRLGLRAGAAGLSSNAGWWEWFGIGMGAAAIPVFGMAFDESGGEKTMLLVAGVTLGTMQLCCLAIGLRALFARRATLLRRATLSRVLMPAYAVGMLSMAVLMPLYHAEEKHWIARDTLMTYSAAAPAFTRYDYEVTQQLQRETLEIVGEKR